MSLPRASVNCERCYTLASALMEQEIKRLGRQSLTGEQLLNPTLKQQADEKAFQSKEIRKQAYERVMENDQVYAARNNALKALEQKINDVGSMTETVKCSIDCLIECRICQYTSPAIVLNYKRLLNS